MQLQKDLTTLWARPAVISFAETEKGAVNLWPIGEYVHTFFGLEYILCSISWQLSTCKFLNMYEVKIPQMNARTIYCKWALYYYPWSRYRLTPSEWPNVHFYMRPKPKAEYLKIFGLWPNTEAETECWIFKRLLSICSVC